MISENIKKGTSVWNEALGCFFFSHFAENGNAVVYRIGEVVSLPRRELTEVE